MFVIGPGEETTYHQARRAQDLGAPQNSPEKSSNFKPVFRASELTRICPNVIQNHKNDPEIMRCPTSVMLKFSFCNTSHIKYLFHTSTFLPKKCQKQNSGNTPETDFCSIQCTRKASNMGTRKQFKIKTNRSVDP